MQTTTERQPRPSRPSRPSRLRYLSAGPYHSEARAEYSLQDAFSEGDVSLSDRPEIVRRHDLWWIEIDA